MPDDASSPVLSAIRDAYAANKSLADRAAAQLSLSQLQTALGPETNSAAVVMKHVAGNLISRWTDPFETDGEKSWRNRDDEFVDSFTSREELLSRWESGWKRLFTTLDDFTDADLSREVIIRGESQTLAKALARSLAHTAYHIGQIVQLCRHHAGEGWQTLTIPRGASEAYNRDHWGDGGKSPS